MKKLLLILGLLSGTILSGKSQSIIYSEGFDSLPATELPAGWSSTLNFGIGWRTDSSNFSSGYSGASGLKNAVIRNTDSSGTYILYSKPFSTLGYSNISVLWAARNSSNYQASGSTSPLFEYSADSGNTWNMEIFIENQPNSTWDYVNNNNSIDLGSDANNKPYVICRWTVNIVNNANGTYRIDDFSMMGDNSQGIQTISGTGTIHVCQNQNQIALQFENSDERTITLISPDGKIIFTSACASQNKNIDLMEYPGGIYLLGIVNNRNNRLLHLKLILH